MIYTDTEGLLDRCHCGAVAGFETSNGLIRARCTDCCEQTELVDGNYLAAMDWNLARREERKDCK